MDDRSLDEEIKLKAQQGRKLARYMSSTRELVEEQIRKAQERGDFDKLEGAGRPLHLKENPYEPAELRMAFKILKDNDFAPYWIELGKEIDNRLQKLREDIKSFKAYTPSFAEERSSERIRVRFKRKKELFLAEKRRELEKINRAIIDYNLHCPTFRAGRATLLVDQEMRS